MFDDISKMKQDMGENNFYDMVIETCDFLTSAYNHKYNDCLDNFENNYGTWFAHVEHYRYNDTTLRVFIEYSFSFGDREYRQYVFPIDFLKLDIEDIETSRVDDKGEEYEVEYYESLKRIEGLELKEESVVNGVLENNGWNIISYRDYESYMRDKR